MEDLLLKLLLAVIHEELLKLLRANNLSISYSTMSKNASGINYVWRAYGKPEDHQAATLALMGQEDIAELRVV